MSCILRASGKVFDIDLYLKGKNLDVVNSYRKGETRRLPSKSGDILQDRSGLSIKVSFADMNQFDQQLEDVQSYLTKYTREIKELTNFSGVESAYLDFGVGTKSPFWSTYVFPANLVRLAGELNLGLCISTYPTDEDEET
jgi:hypothetical protein